MYLILQGYCNKYAVNTTCNHILLECIPVYFSIFVTYVMCCVVDCSINVTVGAKPGLVRTCQYFEKYCFKNSIKNNQPCLGSGDIH